ncbi:hypothetical protein B4U80_12799, partial [Leptotrombidium deliense]
KQLISEDLKKEAVNTANELIFSLKSDLSAYICDTDFRPNLGHSIALLLRFAVAEKCKELKRLSVETLYNLIEKSVSGEHKSAHCKSVYAYFLPGLSSGLTNVLTSDDKVNRDLLVVGLKTLSLIFTITLSATDESAVNNASQEQQFFILRNEDWFTSVSQKLHSAFQKIVNALISHDSPEIRMQLLTTCAHIIEECSPTFVQSTIDIVLDVILSMLNDEDDNMKKTANSVLTNLSHNLTTSIILNDLILEKIHKFTSSFPRETRSLSEEKIKSKINILRGYISCLGSVGVNKLMSLEISRQQVLQCFLDLTEFDYKSVHRFYNVINVIDVDTNNYNRVDLSNYHHKRFKHITEPNTVRVLQNCCNLLASLCDKDLLCDFMLELCRGYSASALYLVNCFLKGFPKTTIVNQLSEEYMSKLNFSQSRNRKFDTNSNSSEVLFICELLEGIAIMCHICPEDHEQLFCCKVLYKLIPFSAVENSLIADIAKNCLFDMSNVFKYSSADAMILHNVTFLVNCATIALRDLKSIEEARIVIEVILNICDINYLPYFTRTLHELLFTVDTHHKSSESRAMFKMIYSFAKRINTLNSSTVTNTFSISSQQNLQKFNNFSESIEQLFICKDITENCNIELHDENMNDDFMHKQHEEKSDKELPLYASMITKILERCKHLTSHPHIETRIIVLECIVMGLNAIRQFEGILLPIVHELWTPLVNRMKDEAVVVKCAFSCLLVIAETSKDFAKTRSLNDVFPSIIYFLQQQSKQSIKKESTAYLFTMEYKLQLCFLESLGDLAFNLRIDGAQLWRLLDATLLYLSVFQPISLQKAAMKSVELFMRLDPSVCCYFLVQHCGVNVEKDILSIKCEQWNYEDCKVNVNYLLKKVLT